jgi:uncharacterized protein
MTGPGQYFRYEAQTLSSTSIKGFLLKLSLVFSLLFTFNYCNAQVYHSVDEVPNPKISGQDSYITDPANVLQSAELDSINRIISDLNDKTGVEAAVVIVNNFNEDQDDFTFATELFRNWGIGKKNANNGLLLFIAIDRKKYRFITGYGLEGLLPDADLEMIAKHNLVPDFKRQAYGTGIILVLNTILAYLKQPANHKELEALLQKIKPATNIDWLWYLIPSVLLTVFYWFAVRNLKQNKPKLQKNESKKVNRYETTGGYLILIFCVLAFASIVLLAIGGGYKYLFQHFLQLLPFILYVIFAALLYIRYLFVMGAMRKKYQDDQNLYTASNALQQSANWYSLLSPLLFFKMRMETEEIHKNNSRFEQTPTDKQGNPMVRINRDENKTGAPYLSNGQQVEEQKQVYCYDIWVNNSSEVKLIPIEGEEFARYDQCSECGFKTLAEPSTVEIVKATTKREGKEKTIRVCDFCKNEVFISESVIPVVDVSSGSSSSRDSSSSSSNSSSSSSSGSGNWGGGSTGGGGAGGSW